MNSQADERYAWSADHSEHSPFATAEFPDATIVVDEVRGGIIAYTATREDALPLVHAKEIHEVLVELANACEALPPAPSAAWLSPALIGRARKLINALTGEQPHSLGPNSCPPTP
ncbi:MAG: hypothetical protein Q8P41_18465 [Pseudomonadota bacterium]|nr:hypothetical protein [Pseudomonadota bacterium]